MFWVLDRAMLGGGSDNVSSWYSGGRAVEGILAVRIQCAQIIGYHFGREMERPRNGLRDSFLIHLFFSHPFFSLLIIPSQFFLGFKQAMSGCATSMTMKQKPFSSLLVPRAQLCAPAYGIDLFRIGISLGFGTHSRDQSKYAQWRHLCRCWMKFYLGWLQERGRRSPFCNRFGWCSDAKSLVSGAVCHTFGPFAAFKLKHALGSIFRCLVVVLFHLIGLNPSVLIDADFGSFHGYDI